MHEHTDVRWPTALSGVRARAHEAQQEAHYASLNAAEIRERVTATKIRTAALLERARTRLAAAHETLNHTGRRLPYHPAPAVTSVSPPLPPGSDGPVPVHHRAASDGAVE